MKCIVLLACSAVLLGGCATKSFGRMQPLSASERGSFACQDINTEIDKVASFREQVRKKSRVDAASVLAFVDDFGIGNAMARQRAEKSATQRLTELNALKVERGCAATSLTVAEGDKVDRAVARAAGATGP